MEKQTTEPITVDVMGAARMLGLGRSTVLGLADSGELPRLRFGRRMLYAVSDIERLVEQRRRSASRAAESGLFRLPPTRPGGIAAQGVVRALLAHHPGRRHQAAAGRGGLPVGNRA